MKKVILLLLLNVILLKANWTSLNGPYQESVNSIYNASGKYYIGTGSGFYSSTDATNWTKYSNNIPSTSSIYAIIKNLNTIYIGTSDNGIMASNDEGLTWTSSSQGLTTKTIYALYYFNNNFYAGTDIGIFMSKNGSVWARVAVNTVDSSEVYGFIDNGTNVYAATYNGIFYTRNNGLVWLPFNSGITDETIYGFTILGANLFAATDYGVYAYKGSSWVPDTSGMGDQYANCISNDGTNLYAGGDYGVYKSSNLGSSWQLINSIPLPDSTVVLSIFANSKQILTGYDSEGIYFSANKGSTWKQSSIGLTTQTTTAVNLLPGLTSTLISGNNLGGVYSYENSQWVARKSGLYDKSVNSIFIPKNNSNLLIGTDIYGVFYPQNLTTSLNWNASTGLPDSTYAFCFTETNQSILMGSDKGIYKSVDNGKSWTIASTDIGANEVIYGLAYSDPTSFAATTTGLYYSPNDGSSWVSVTTGATSDVEFYTVIINGNNVYAGGTGGKLYISKDLGVNWTSLVVGDTSLQINAIYIISNNVYLGTNNKGVLVSYDGAKTFNPVNEGLGNIAVYSFTIYNNQLVIGSYNGVWARNLSEFKPSSSVKISALNNDRIYTNNTGNQSLYINATDVSKISINVKSSNESVLPAGNVVISGTAYPKNIKYTPKSDAKGLVTIFIIAFDGIAYDTAKFDVRIVDKPKILNARDTSTQKNVPIVLNLSFQGGFDKLTATAVSQNPNLVNQNNLIFTIFGPSSDLLITPETNQVGVCKITIYLNDGTMVDSASFNLTILDQSGVEDENSNSFTISNFNQTNNELIFGINSIYDTQLNIGVYDILANNYYSSIQGISNGINSFNLPINNLNVGVYILKLSTNDMLITKKFVILK